MSLGSNIGQVAVVSAALLVNKQLLRSRPKEGVLRTKILLVALVLSLVFWDVWEFTRPQNYYTFFGIPKAFTAEDLKRQKLTLSRMYHPDKSETDGTEFAKVQELHEVFSSSPRNANALRIYDLYKTDLLSLYFDKLGNTRIETFQVQKSSDLWIENYMILFLMLFCLRELGVNDKRVKLGFVVLLLAAVLPEFAVYGVSEDFVTAAQVRGAIDSFPDFAAFRTVEVLELWKRVVIAAFLALLTLYVNFVKGTRKRTVLRAVEEAKALRAEDTEKAKELSAFLAEKHRKLDKRRRTSERTRSLFFILMLIYWLCTYFQII